MKTRKSFYEVAARYKVGVSTLYDWWKRGRIIAPHKLGGKTFWFAEDLDEWEQAGCPRPCDEKKKEAKNEQLA